MNSWKLFSESIEKTRKRLQRRTEKTTMAIVKVGDGENQWQKRSQAFAKRVARDLKVDWLESKLGNYSSSEEIVSEIRNLSKNDNITGIILSRPFRNRSIQEMRLFHEAVEPFKDIEGMHPISIGRIVSYSRTKENPKFMWPLTARASVEICASLRSLEGMEALVIGSSDVIAKPVCSLLQTRGSTVTVCPAFSPKLSVLTRSVDAIFSSQSSPDFTLDSDMIKPNSILIDLGFRVDEQHENVIGDINFTAMQDIAGYASSIKHGIGLLRIAYLFENLATAYEHPAHE